MRRRSNFNQQSVFWIDFGDLSPSSREDADCKREHIEYASNSILSLQFKSTWNVLTFIWTEVHKLFWLLRPFQAGSFPLGVSGFSPETRLLFALDWVLAPWDFLFKCSYINVKLLSDRSFQNEINFYLLQFTELSNWIAEREKISVFILGSSYWCDVRLPLPEIPG